MAFSLGNNAHNQAFHTSPGTVTISLSAQSVVIVQVGMTSLSGAGAALTVSTVTSTNLTFAKIGAHSRHDTNIGAGATWHDSEAWWAFSSGALTNEVISVAVTAAGSPNTGVIQAVECKGVLNPSSPFDTNASLPKLNDGNSSGPSIASISTDSSTPIGLWLFGSSFANISPNSPGTWTVGPAAGDPGGATQANCIFDYQVFASAQSSATWAQSTSATNWMVIGAAFAQIATPAAVPRSYACIVGL